MPESPALLSVLAAEAEEHGRPEDAEQLADRALASEPGLLAPNRVLETLLENVANRVAEPLPIELRGWRREVVGERVEVRCGGHAARS